MPVMIRRPFQLTGRGSPTFREITFMTGGSYRVRGPSPLLRPFSALERAHDLPGDPAAVEVAGLRLDPLAVDEAGLHGPGVEGDVAHHRLVDPRRQPGVPPRRLGTPPAHLHRVVAGGAL